MAAPATLHEKQIALLRSIHGEQRPVDLNARTMDEQARAILIDLHTAGLVRGTVFRLGESQEVTAFYNVALTKDGEVFIGESEPSRTTDPELRDHTLLNYFRKASLTQRLGMLGFLASVFTVGVLAGKTKFFSRLMDLLKDIKP